VNAESSSFLTRNEFLIRRLHSLSGLIPVGAYMCVHLLTNASILNGFPSKPENGYATFQNAVFNIHKLGAALPIIEWVFIFIPILFHAILGVVIIRGGLPNSGKYRYGSNYRYTLQRATGMIAFVFIMWHVFHMHGWFHADVWVENVAEPLAGAQFRPYNAASTGGEAMQASIVVPILYSIGMLSCVFHLANGLWTMGITWGVWITPEAQRRANYVCGAFGILLAIVGMSAVVGFENVDVEQARKTEDEMREIQVKAGLISDDPHKTADGEHDEEKQSKVSVRVGSKD